MPRDWIDMMKASIRKIGSVFNTHRMVSEYAERAYVPGHDIGVRWTEDGLKGAQVLAAWRRKVTEAWPGVTLRLMDWTGREVSIGQAHEVTIRAKLASLSADDVSVEVYHGPLDFNGEIRGGRVAVAAFVAREGDESVFKVKVPCETTGQYGVAARILPRHGDLLNPYTPLLLTWE
jgi:starch phosphorylase